MYRCLAATSRRCNCQKHPANTKQAFRWRAWLLTGVWKIILVQHSADVQLCVNYGLASFLHRGFFFIFFAFFFLVSMAPQRSSQWNLLPPLWSCNTRSVMSQSSKYIAVIRMHPLMGFEMVFNWTPPRWCVRRSRKEKKKQKTLNRIQIAFKARGQIFAPENKSRIFAPHKSSRAAPGRFFPSDQLWILTRSSFFLSAHLGVHCLARRSISLVMYNWTILFMKQLHSVRLCKSNLQTIITREI